ncbi:MAG: alkaline phosphatase D family protein [Pseudanabaenales cyanobacterium]|nr:alkaline phosphatase D family protein [Pseudanabaenales cyanobacterium]
MKHRLTRRSFLALSAASAGVALSSRWLEPAIAQLTDESRFAVQVGDVTKNRAIIWTRGDRNSHFAVEISISPNFSGKTRIVKGGQLTSGTDYTGKIDLGGLHPDTPYYYRTLLQEQGIAGRGSFQTAPSHDQNSSVRFVWAADMAGQGWGRNPELKITAFDGEVIQGGYVVFDVMRKFSPDFAVFCGDMIYADNPISPTQEIPSEVGGGIWINEPAKDFVAITLDGFRANWKYNLGDEKFRRFLSETPIYVEWDDHEVTNNWYPGEILPAGDPYNELSADILAEPAEQSLFEYNPIRGENIFRKFRHGKHLELFLLDERSFRDPNPQNSDPNGIEMLGQEQFEWLKRSLSNSSATWKVIATHDPFTIVTGGETDRDAWSQNDPAVLGREGQLRDLLKFIKDRNIKNVVSITADVHFAAAIKCDPEQAVFQEFNPFWEFVIGPINAGAFGPGQLDPSFGPEYKFVRGPGASNLPVNLPPPNLQFFGSMEIDGRTAELTACIHSITGEVVYKKVLIPDDSPGDAGDDQENDNREEDDREGDD